MPASNSAVSSAEAATRRPRSHIAMDGNADSTSPRPASSRSDAVGSPIAAATAFTTPSGTDARNVT